MQVYQGVHVFICGVAGKLTLGGGVPITSTLSRSFSSDVRRDLRAEISVLRSWSICSNLNA